VEAIADDTCGQAVIRQLGPQGIFVAMNHIGAAIAEMSRDRCASLRSLPNLFSISGGMAYSYNYAQPLAIMYEIDCSECFRGKGNFQYFIIGSLVKLQKLIPVRRPNPLLVMGSSVTFNG
jgi:hypothetical protein